MYFLWLNNISFDAYIKVCLSVHPLMAIWDVVFSAAVKCIIIHVLIELLYHMIILTNFMVLIFLFCFSFD